MTNIEKRHIINTVNLSDESYFSSILQESYACGLLNDSDIENIQLQCIKLLAYKSESYNGGESSSIRVEAAECIMKSIFYTIGLYLKSLPDADCAASELKNAIIQEMYQKGRKLINARLNAAKHLYMLAQRNKINTFNYTYNATLSNNGIGIFFKSYEPDYEAHESPASIDYQLCIPVTDLTGIEFIQKYIGNLFLENEFCGNFAALDIHHLLCGYDEGYKNLLINIFELLFTSAIGCLLAGRNAIKFDISAKEITNLHNELSNDDDCSVALKIRKATEKLLEELNISSLPLRGYIEKCLPKITSDVICAIRTNILSKTFICPANLDPKSKIEFLPGVKMDDEDYRKLINELLICRYSSDKLAIIKEKVKSFSDFEDVLFDAQLCEEELTSLFGILEDVEIAALLKRHPFRPDIQAVDLSEAEQFLRLYLKQYVDQLTADRQKQIWEIASQLIDDSD